MYVSDRSIVSPSTAGTKLDNIDSGCQIGQTILVYMDLLQHVCDLLCVGSYPRECILGLGNTVGSLLQLLYSATFGPFTSNSTTHDSSPPSCSLVTEFVKAFFCTNVTLLLLIPCIY